MLWKEKQGQKKGSRIQGRGQVLTSNRVAKGAVIVKGHFGESVEESKEVSHMAIWGRSILDREKSVCRDPKLGMSVMYSTNIQDGSGPG